MKRCLVLVLCALGACSAPPSPARERVEIAITQAQTQIQQCWGGVVDSQLYARLKDKMPIPSSGGPSLLMQNNTALATPDDVTALLALHDGPMANCRKVTLEAYDRIDPSLVAIIADNYSQNDAELNKVIRRQATWGQYSEAYARLGAKTRAELAEADRRIEAGLQASEAARQAQRQQAAANLLAWSAQQQALRQQQAIILQQSQPRITNCSYIGSSLSCTTY